MIKSHTFTLGKYRILWGEIEACCDVPSEPDEQLNLMTPPVTDCHTFCVAAHEAEHADGLPDSVIHDADGYPVHGGRHKFLWRIARGLKCSGAE